MNTYVSSQIQQNNWLRLSGVSKATTAESVKRLRLAEGPSMYKIVNNGSNPVKS